MRKEVHNKSEVPTCTMHDLNSSVYAGKATVRGPFWKLSYPSSCITTEHRCFLFTPPELPLRLV